MAELSLRRLLQTAVHLDASDVHIQHGSPPMLRVNGVVRYVDCPPLTPAQLNAFAREMLDEYSAGLLNQEGSCDLSYDFSSSARFRVNVFYQNDVPALALRRVHARIPSFEELNLPPLVRDIACTDRGLVLVTGTTSSGKSTAIAAMLGYINHNFDRRIITIEDPVEFVHVSDRCLVAQIEVGRDTRSYEDAIRHVLRQDPDVLMVGEMRDLASVRVALRAADTGHLVFATVHATNVQQTVERIIAMFDPAQHNLLLTQLALNIRAVIALRLAQARGGGRVPVCEIMRGTGTIRKLILENRVTAIPQAVTNRDQGMQSFDQHLEELYRARNISADETLKLATNPDALTMALRGVKTREMEQGLVR
ncbi:MAG: PilT/PilU family type 4a pilus ATPase [Phycisphaerae bacterium]|nr:PilT/PilU family type 4a pilus ATPase [Phycisphaerae bacterium]